MSASFVDLASKNSDALTEFNWVTGCRISASFVDFMSKNSDVLTEIN